MGSRRLRPDVTHTRGGGAAAGAETGGLAARGTSGTHGAWESRRWPRVPAWLRAHTRASQVGGRGARWGPARVSDHPTSRGAGPSETHVGFPPGGGRGRLVCPRARACPEGARVFRIHGLDHVGDEPGSAAAADRTAVHRAAAPPTRTPPGPAVAAPRRGLAQIWAPRRRGLGTRRAVTRRRAQAGKGV